MKAVRVGFGLIGAAMVGLGFYALAIGRVDAWGGAFSLAMVSLLVVVTLGQECD